MLAIQFHTTGTPSSVLSCADVPQPVPCNGEVLVRMLACPINPSDLMFIRGVYGMQPQLPQTPGFEGVGVVEASGGGWKGRLFTGKRVAVLNPSGGNWAEYSVVPAANVIPLSGKLSDQQAATFFVNPATAWIMTQEVLQIPRRAWLLQTAANSALGRMVIRLGHRRGFRTINVVRRADSVDELRADGAAHVIVFDSQRDDPQELQRAVQTIVGTTGLRYAIDPVGGNTASSVLQTLTSGGRLLLYGTLSDQSLTIPPRELMSRQASVEGFWLGNFMERKSLLFKLRLVTRITRLIQNGTLATHIRATYPLTQIEQGIQDAMESGRNGKVILSTEDISEHG
ncbi:MAG: zinc-dependent alcohol dehydrogenase family protein [Planctomycetaceae bacterium]